MSSITNIHESIIEQLTTDLGIPGARVEYNYQSNIMCHLPTSAYLYWNSTQTGRVLNTCFPVEWISTYKGFVIDHEQTLTNFCNAARKIKATDHKNEQQG